MSTLPVTPWMTASEFGEHGTRAPELLPGLSIPVEALWPKS